MSNAPIDVLTIGNAITDIFAQVDDSFIEKEGMTKSIMHLVEMDRSNYLLSQLPGDRKRVGGGSPKDEMEVFHLVLPETDRMEAYVSHPGQEHCFVISGEVLFEVGEESFHLSTGDSIFIDSQQPHRARSAGGADAQILMTVAAADVSRVEFDWWRPTRAALQERPQGSSNGRTS